MAKYIIEKAGLGKSPEIEINKEIYQDLQRAKEYLLSHFQFEEKFDIILENFKDFEHERYSSSIDDQLFSGQTTPIMFSRRRNLIRRLMNVLTSIKLYLDVILSLEKEKDHYDEIKNFISGQYDGNFNYRLMEALRNHIQHRGVPISASQNSSVIRKSDKSFHRTNTGIYLEITDLISDPKLKASLRDELEAITTDRIELNRSLSEYIGCISRIHNYWRSLNKQRLDNSIVLYLHYFDQYRNMTKDKMKNIYLSISIYEEEIIPAEYFDISDTIIENIEYLAHKNFNVDNLSTRFVSSLSQFDFENYFK
jgi:hypothetical protein